MGSTYHLRSHGQVWLHMRYQGLVAKGGLCKFQPMSGTQVHYNQAVYFEVDSPKWQALKEGK